jgi:triphosphoribosyl-dephospho-CoA synthase
VRREEFSAAHLREAYIGACEGELRAFKPGNVSIYADGHDMTVEDFRVSARVSAGPLIDAELSLGERIYYALDNTASSVGCNTNLGIVLLCAPLLGAMLVPGDGTLRERLGRVLDSTTAEDADWVYQGIRRASPAGMGASDDEDVNSRPTVTLIDTMRIAAGRDRIAYQYISVYRDVFETAKNRYYTALRQWGDETWATLATFVGLLREFPDSHIERKYGKRFTGMVTQRMAFLDERLSVSDNPKLLMDHLREIDEEFKSVGVNPGTTADLTAATLLAVRLEELLDCKQAKDF